MGYIWLQVSPERRAFVIDEITQGSEPGTRFYAMVITSSLIASLGLIANSTAVVIGAMLVAPLMTPIFGMALGLVRGNAELLGRALRAEIMGVIMAIGLPALLGLLPLALEATPEMIARTRPNLFDLLVAVLAGFAGAFAMVDERISPSLPGVAIATAIVPPLANTGLCLALGAYQGATGSFLLFLANFISILLVASAVFIAANMSPWERWSQQREFVRRATVATLGFVAVAIFLTYSLVVIVQARTLTRTVNTVLATELAKIYAVHLDQVLHHMDQTGTLHVLATVRTPQIVNPDEVKRVQDAIATRVARPTDLVVRSILASDVGATGTTRRVTALNLDGSFLNTHVSPFEVKTQQIEQVVREQLAFKVGFQLIGVELGRNPAGDHTVIVTIEGHRPLSG